MSNTKSKTPLEKKRIMASGNAVGSSMGTHSHQVQQSLQQIQSHIQEHTKVEQQLRDMIAWATFTTAAQVNALNSSAVPLPSPKVFTESTIPQLKNYVQMQLLVSCII